MSDQRAPISTVGWAWAVAVTVGLLAIPGPMLVAVVAPEFKLRGLIR